MQLKDPQMHFHLLDHLGSSALDISPVGEALATRSFFPFGEAQEEVEHIPHEGNVYGFTGKEEDEDTGLHYFEARFYDAGVGRFMGVDPWVGDESDPQTLNKYSYVVNRPLVAVDPSGEVVVFITGWSGRGDDMENLQQQFNQKFHSQGLEAPQSKIFAHGQQKAARGFINEAISNNPDEPLVIIGHSFGGDSSIELAKTLQSDGVDIDLLVQIDSIGINDEALPSNVGLGINFYQEGGSGLDGAKNVSGSVNIRAPGASHTNIDSDRDVGGITAASAAVAHRDFLSGKSLKSVTNSAKKHLDNLRNRIKRDQNRRNSSRDNKKSSR